MHTSFAPAPESKSRSAVKQIFHKRQALQDLLFPADPGYWLSLLRIGLALQLIGYTWTLRHDWNSFFEGGDNVSTIRALTDTIVSAQNKMTPHLGWLITMGRLMGGNEHIVIQLVWFLLLMTGCLLLVGLFCRSAAILGWFLYLCSAKSSLLFSYGVDNFTTIGLFYLMIAPLPDRLSLDCRWRKKRSANPERLGFHRRVLQLHLCIIYFFAGLSKSLGLEWWNGVSIWKALTRPPFDVISPDLLIRFEAFFPLAGIAVCLLETGYPIFIWMKRTQRFWLVAILLMHLSIGLTMGLYLFALIMIVLNVSAFGPTLFKPQPAVSVRPIADPQP